LPLFSAAAAMNHKDDREETPKANRKTCRLLSDVIDPSRKDSIA
jgi:hypothetical protein